MKSRWEHFSKDELSCTGACPRCSGSDSNMNAEFMAKLVKLRKLCGFSFPITSAYRCPDRNKEVSKTGANGPHTTGKAIDILASGPEAYVLVMLALQLNFTGIGINQKGPHNKRFIHLDYNLEGKARPRIWSY
jgi:zinc D-Ala-D-Ala carboxypeptidase